MIAIYRKTFTVMGQFWWFILLIAVSLETAAALAGARAGLGATLYLQFSYLYFLHRNLLLGEGADAAFGKARNGKPSARRGFMWVTFLYLAAVIGLSIAVALTVGAASLQIGPGILILLMVLAIGSWIGLSIFGTAFPASAIAAPYGLGITLQRARQTATGVALRLLLGPGIFGLVGIALEIIVNAVFHISSGVKPTDLHGGLTLILVAQGFSGIAARLTGMVSSTLAVAVLCDAYRRIQPAPVDAAA